MMHPSIFPSSAMFQTSFLHVRFQNVKVIVNSLVNLVKAILLLFGTFLLSIFSKNREFKNVSIFRISFFKITKIRWPAIDPEELIQDFHIKQHTLIFRSNLDGPQKGDSSIFGNRIGFSLEKMNLN